MTRLHFTVVMHSERENDWRGQVERVARVLPREWRFDNAYEKTEKDFWRFLSHAYVQGKMDDAVTKHNAMIQVMLGLKCFPRNHVAEWAKGKLGHTSMPGVVFYDHHAIDFTPDVWAMLLTEHCVVAVFEKVLA